MAEMMEELKQQQRRDTRRAWWFAGVAIMMVLLVVGFVWMQDVDAPDDAAMLPIFTEGGGKKNELLQLVEEMQVLMIPDRYRRLAPQSQMGEWEAEREVSSFFRIYPEILQFWEKLAASDATQWRWRFQDQEEYRYVDIGDDGKHDAVWTSFRNLASTVWLRSLFLAREGKVREAVKLAMELRDVGKGLQNAEGSRLYWLNALTFERIGLVALKNALVLIEGDADLLLEVQQQLGEESFEMREAFRTALQVDYFLTKSSRLTLDQVGDRWIDKVKFVVSYKKNRTLWTYVNFQQPLIESLAEDDAEVRRVLEWQKLQKKQWETRGRKNILHPNAFGDHLVMGSRTSNKGVYKRCAMMKNELRMLRVALAVRRFELANGQVPDLLEKLVPEYLDEVPKDEVDGQPMRWDASRQRIYSVNWDRSDDGGSFRHPYDLNEADYGLLYPWGKESKKRDQERYGVKRSVN